MARRAHCGKSHVWDLEQGRKTPSRSIAVALDAALGAQGRLLAAAAASTHESEHDRPIITSTYQGVDRRDFVAATAAALTVGRIAPRNIDPALADYFDDQLAGHYRADMLLGPHDLIATVAAQYTLIDRLTRVADDGPRRGLLRSGAVYAALIGWLHQDAGDLAAAAFWRGTALESAQRSRDPQLVAYALINQASMRTDLGDGLGVLDLCDTVLAGAGQLSPKLRVMLLQQQAHGASLVGDRSTVDAALDRAAPLLNHCDDGQPWGNACLRTPNYLQVQRATCYGRLGLGPAAAALWAEILATMPTSAHRDRGTYLARHATASARAGEPDQALVSARAAATVAVDTGSWRIRGELTALQRTMRPWHDAAVGRELDEILAPLRET